MTRFSYIVRGKDGKKITGSEEAKQAEELVAKLQDKGLLVVSVFPEEGEVKRKRRQFTHRRIRNSDLVFFSRQLAVMLSASVPLLRTLDTILKQIESGSLHDVISVVKKDVEGGLSLKEALVRHPRTFSDFWLGLVETGEASGNLPAVLERLATYLEKKASLQGKFISAIIYPSILFLVAIVALSVFIFVVVPKFNEIFKGFDVKLPALTQAVISVSTFLGQNVLWVIGGIAALIIAYRYYSRTAFGKRVLDRIKLRLPLFGNFFRVSEIERFTLEMSILIDSGVPIIYTLDIIERGFANTIMGDALINVTDGVRQGKSLGKYLERELVFPALLVQMVTVGEETGELPKMLKKLSEFYEEYMDNFIVRLSALFEPVIIIFMGVIIGTIIISMFLPIFSIASIGAGAR